MGLKSDDWTCDAQTFQLPGQNSAFATQPGSYLYAKLLDFQDFSDITKVKAIKTVKVLKPAVFRFAEESPP